jgi:plastocyanin
VTDTWRRVVFAVVAAVTAALAVFAVARAVASDTGSGTATPPASSTPPAGGSTSAPSSGAGAVTIKDFTFSPAPVTVKLGAAVTWTNQDPFDHSIKSADGTFTSQPLGQGKTFTATFSKAGTFAYICGIHNSMKGTVVVAP